MEIENEKQFQISLARLLTAYGFEVYLDKNISEFPVFKGDREKPDILVFYKEYQRENKVFNISNPFAIETKISSHQFNNVSRSILQIKKYVGNEYYTDKWKGKIDNVFLSTELGIKKGLSCMWAGGSGRFNEGLNWGLIRILFQVSKKTGVLIGIDDKLIIETPNIGFELKEGIIKPIGCHSTGRYVEGD